MKMSRRKSRASATGFSRREFLLTVGAAPPTMSLMESGAAVHASPSCERRSILSGLKGP